MLAWNKVGYDGIAQDSHVYMHMHIPVHALARKHFPSPAAQMQDNEAQVKKRK